MRHKYSDRELRSIIMKSLEREAPRRLPFTADADGFRDLWWVHRSVPPGPQDFDWFTFEMGGEEVARAEVNFRSRVHRDYVVPSVPTQIVEITFIEVRNDLVGRGIGPAVVEQIIAHYPDPVFAASPVEAIGYWRELGWLECERIERQPVGNSLFILDTRNL